MPTQIITKNSSTAAAVPTAAVLVQGELAVNVTDKRLFTENASAAVVELGTNPSALTCPSVTITGGSITGITDLAVADGGTGASSLTGIVKGNGTSAFTAVTAPTGTIVGTTDTQTLTNKTLAFASNTLTGVQASLVSGTNIKTINSATILGSGDVAVQPTLVSGTNIKTINSTTLLGSGDIALQSALVSGTNIKTINSTSLLGSGDIAVQPTLVSGVNLKTLNGDTLLGASDIVIPIGSLVLVASTFALIGTPNVEVLFYETASYDSYVIVATEVTIGSGRLIERWKLGGAYVTTSTYYTAPTLSTTGNSSATSGEVTSLSIRPEMDFTSIHYNCSSTTARKRSMNSVVSSDATNIRGETSMIMNTGTGAKTGVRYETNTGANITGVFRLYGVYKG